MIIIGMIASKSVASIIAPVGLLGNGNISTFVFGVIAASGIRVLVESKVDYNKPVNLMLTAVVMGIGVSTASITLGTVTLSGMSLATVVAIVLSICFNLISKLRGEA